MKEFYNIFLFCFIGLIAYLIFKKLNLNSLGPIMFREGFVDSSGNNLTNLTNHASGAKAYSTNIKAVTDKENDKLNIGKYKNDYESVILNMDDLISSQMLKTILSLDSLKILQTDDPSNQDDIFKMTEQLSHLQNSKLALNSVMKMVDKTKSTK